MATKMQLLARFLCVTALAAPTAGSGSLASSLSSGALSVDLLGGGLFTLSVDGAVWFTSEPVQFSSGGAMLSTADGSLALDGVSSGTSSDDAGTYSFVKMGWKATKGSGPCALT